LQDPVGRWSHIDVAPVFVDRKKGAHDITGAGDPVRLTIACSVSVEHLRKRTVGLTHALQESSRAGRTIEQTRIAGSLEEQQQRLNAARDVEREVGFDDLAIETVLCDCPEERT